MSVTVLQFLQHGCRLFSYYLIAGWSSLEARLAHNQEVEGSNPSLRNSIANRQNKSKDVKIIKQISKTEIEKLLSEGVIRNTRRGYIDRNGNLVGYYRTKGVAKKRYIEDKYVK